MRALILHSASSIACGLPSALGRTARGSVLAAAICGAYPGLAGAAGYQAIYYFDGSPQGAPQGAYDPASTLAVDAQGRLYGTTYQGGLYLLGTVFRLTPPATPGAAWMGEVLFNFGQTQMQGNLPVAGVTLGSDGSVYGTTELGGLTNGNPQFPGRGLVFKLANTAGWPETVLHNFTGGQGGVPNSSLLFGPDGLLYGGTLSFNYNGSKSGGISYSISPLGDAAGFTDLYRFGADGTPYAPSNLVLLSTGPQTVYLGGDEFGGPGNQGGVFSLTVAPGKPAKEQMIYQFAQGADVGRPSDGPVIGRGALAGSFYGCGTVGGGYGQGGIFQITRHNGAAATETVIYSFGAHPNDPKAIANPVGPPRCSLLQGKGSNKLYGVTGAGGEEGGGAFFEVDPPAPGQTSWTEKVDFSFTGGPFPYLGLAEPLAAPVELNGHFYGSAFAGGSSGFGGIYELSP